MNLKTLKQLAVFALFASLAVPALVGPAQADLIKQSAAYSRQVLMTSSSDHVTGATGLTLTVTVSKAGAAYASVTPTVTELGNGVYAIALASGNTNTLGSLDIHVAATGADPTDTHDQVVGFDPASDLGAAALATIGTTVTATNTQTSPANQQVNVVAGNTTYGAAKTSDVTTVGTAIAGLPNAAANGTAAANAILTTPSNKLATASGGGVTATTVSDKAGYSLTASLPVVDGSGRVLLQPTQAGVTIPTVTAVTSPVTLPSTAPAGYGGTGATAAQVAAAILTNPANLLTTDSAGKIGTNNFPATVTASNLPTDYQQRGVAVTLPTTAPTGYGGGTAPTVQQIAAGILVNPAQPIVTNSSGYVTTSNPATGGSGVTEATIWAYGNRTLTAQADTPGTATLLTKVGTPTGASLAADIAAVQATSAANGTAIAALPASVANAVLGGIISGTVTLKQATALNLAYNFGLYTRSKTSTSQTLVFQNQSGQTIATSVSGLDTTGNPTGRTSVTFSNLP